jgi:hypothetical protein
MYVNKTKIKNHVSFELLFSYFIALDYIFVYEL